MLSLFLKGMNNHINQTKQISECRSHVTEMKSEVEDSGEQFSRVLNTSEIISKFFLSTMRSNEDLQLWPEHPIKFQLL